MSGDEAIKILTENDISDFYFDHTECYDFSDEENYRQAVETLINEYNNLKQIEEAHRIENGKLREEIKDLEETLDNTWSGFKGIQEDLTNQLGNMPPYEEITGIDLLLED